MQLSFLMLAIKRSRERWALTLLSLAGIALTVGLIASIPIFTDAVGLRMLNRELARHASGNANPPLSMRYYRIPSSTTPMSVQEAIDTGAWLRQLTAAEIGIPAARTYVQIGSHAMTLRARPDDPRYQDKEMRSVRVNAVPHIEDQINIIEGTPFTEGDTADELLLWARPEFLAKLGVQAGEVYELFSANALHPETPLRCRIAGIWEAKDADGPFWYRDPHEQMAEEFLTTVGGFARFIAPYRAEQTDFDFWYVVLDETHIRFDRVDQYTLGAERAQVKAQRLVADLQVDRSPIEPLKDVQIRTRILKQLLFGFSLPVVVLLLFFVGLIATITVRYQENEVAVLMSRGASRSQVLGISALEGLVHIALGTVLGVLASLSFARAMSLSSGFMAFGGLQPLPVSISTLDARMVALALVVSLLARLFPALRSASRTIVSYGHERARARHADLALRIVLNGVLLAVCGYACYRLYTRGTMGLVSYEPGGGAVLNDPLLFAAPTLFVLTVALLAAQSFPILMRLLDVLGRVSPSTSFYLGLRNLSRESGPYAIPLFLVITCLALGSFEASIARSADVWLTDRWRYKVGADYGFTETSMQDGNGILHGQNAWLLPPDSFRALPGVTDATRVGVFPARVQVGGTDTKVKLLGIDRLDFARVAYFRNDYAGVSLGELLNKLAPPNSILVTSAFLRDTSLNVGDRFPLNVMVQANPLLLEFVIVGTFDYFPTVYEASEGLAAVTNLDYVFNQSGGPAPHSLWLRTVPSFDEKAFKEALLKMDVVMDKELNGRALASEDAQREERLGIFGNLTVGFLAGSALACLGILVYTLASLAGRLHRFAILRALGLNLRQVLATLSVEYLGVILYGVLVGAAAGVATARLFVPFFQFTEDPTMMVPPFTPYIATTQIGWIAIGYLVILSLAELIILTSATRRKLFQVLRMGFQE